MNVDHKKLYPKLVETVNKGQKILENRSLKNVDLVNEAIKQRKEAFGQFTKDAELALALLNDQEEFKKLAPVDIVILAAEQVEVMKQLLEKKDLTKLLPAEWLVQLVTCYAIGVSPLEVGKGIFLMKGTQAHQVPKKIRETICLDIAKQAEIVEKLNPAAKILLFSSIKKSAVYKKQKTNLTMELQKKIDSAYDIRTNYNPEETSSWDKWPWPSVAGRCGIGDWHSRAGEFFSCALWDSNQYFENGDDHDAKRKATAELLITDPRFEDKFTASHKNYRLRFELSKKYYHIAKLVIDNPEYRGTKGTTSELTEEDLKKLAEMHNLEYKRNIVVEQQRPRSDSYTLILESLPKVSEQERNMEQSVTREQVNVIPIETVQQNSVIQSTPENGISLEQKIQENQISQPLNVQGNGEQQRPNDDVHPDVRYVMCPFL